jgi:hypothetical protein
LIRCDEHLSTDQMPNSRPYVWPASHWSQRQHVCLFMNNTITHLATPPLKPPTPSPTQPGRGDVCQQLLCCPPAVGLSSICKVFSCSVTRPTHPPTHPATQLPICPPLVPARPTQDPLLPPPHTSPMPCFFSSAERRIAAINIDFPFPSLAPVQAHPAAARQVVQEMLHTQFVAPLTAAFPHLQHVVHNVQVRGSRGSAQQLSAEAVTLYDGTSHLASSCAHTSSAPQWAGKQLHPVVDWAGSHSIPLHWFMCSSNTVALNGRERPVCC